MRFYFLQLFLFHRIVFFNNFFSHLRAGWHINRIGAYKPFAMLQQHQFNQPASLYNPGNDPGKKSFLVFAHHKYMTVPTETIAFFYVKFESTVILTFDRREYSVKYSLEQIQQLLSEQQFFRLNRQYLINFKAIKEVEHYFARKLLVQPVIAFAEKLLVSRERAKDFLNWLERR
jgi:two-component system, LytTR family, response regulator LytT